MGTVTPLKIDRKSAPSWYEHIRSTATSEDLALARLLQKAAWPHSDSSGLFEPAPLFLAQSVEIRSSKEMASAVIEGIEA